MAGRVRVVERNDHAGQCGRKISPLCSGGCLHEGGFHTTDDGRPWLNGVDAFFLKLSATGALLVLAGFLYPAVLKRTSNRGNVLHCCQAERRGVARRERWRLLSVTGRLWGRWRSDGERRGLCVVSYVRALSTSRHLVTACAMRLHEPSAAARHGRGWPGGTRPARCSAQGRRGHDGRLRIVRGVAGLPDDDETVRMDA